MGLDSYVDTAPNGEAYVSAYLPWPLTTVRRVSPGQPADRPYKVHVGRRFPGDHPAVAVDQIMRRPGRDRLYLVSSTYFIFSAGPGLLWTSDNGGRRWEGPVDFPDPLPGNSTQISVVASGGDTVMAAWFENPRTYTVRAALIDHETGAFIAGSEITLGEPGFWYGRFGGRPLPSASVVREGPYVGRAYIAWPQSRSPGVNDIFLSWWDPAGQAWSAPVRVNDDGDAANDQEFPSVAAAPDGSAYVAWMDTRDDPSYSTALIYAARVTPDGQVHPNHRLTDCPTYEETYDVHHLGDYFNGDASQGAPTWVFPKIRAEGEDSDVFLLEAR